MKTTAAVLVETGQPLQLADLEIPVLKPGQVLVEIAFSGVCHTQLLEARGHRGDDPYLPHCLGHEGSGIVREVGDSVTKCQAGDRVILSWMKGSGGDVPGTVYDWNGRTVNAGGVTTFSRHSVVSENRVTVIPDSLTLADAALLGCAVPTGLGAVFNTANVQPGHNVAVFGTGGIGLCAVAATAIAGAETIVAVDTSLERLDAARIMGATDCVDATTAAVLDQIASICNRGVDVAIEATGRPDVMTQALLVVRNQGGKAVIVGNAHAGETMALDPKQLNLGKQLLGTWGGDNQPDRDFPKYCDLVVSGRLPLTMLTCDTYRLDQINDALDDLENRTVTRPLIDMSLM